MKVFTNKGWTRERKHIEGMVESEYKQKALTLDLIGNMFDKDFSTMSINEIDEFFHWCSADVRMYQFCRGMEAGTDSIIDTFEKCGLARKHTLEKLRFRALKNLETHKEEFKKRIKEDSYAQMS